MILKFLLVVFVIGVVYFMFIKKKPLKKPTPEEKKNSPQESDDMVACTTCGTYSELSETIISGNKYYCSSECVDKA